MVRAASRLPADHITVPGRNERRGFPLILHLPPHQAAERLDGARGSPENAAPVSGEVLVVGEGFGYRVTADGGQDWVGVPVAVDGAESQAQGPAAPAGPGRVIGLDLRAEPAAGGGGQPGPGGQQVDGRIAG